jgi:hydroxyethylthiazole kinase-like uncharacterized protein yjeF
MSFKLPVLRPDLHKGEIGKVMIVGGSRRYQGAPIFAALAAERVGCDLISVFAPKTSAKILSHYTLNSFVTEFVMPDLCLKDIGMIMQQTRKSDVLVMGMGLDKEYDTLRAISLILEDAELPVVLDADALQPEILKIVASKSNVVLTPHRGEFKRMFGVDASHKAVEQKAREFGVTILLKSKEDIISNGDQTFVNITGSPKMRIGGTGDALAGIVGAFISLGLEPFDASKSAAYYFGLLGEELAQRNVAIRAIDLIDNLPQFLHKFE